MQHLADTGRASIISRFWTCVLAIVLAFAGIAVPAGTARADDGYTLQITSAESGVTYSLYQIATGTFSTDDDGDVVISNAVINESYLSTIVALIQTYEGYESFSVDGLGTYATATAVLDAVVDICGGDDTTAGRAFANALAAYVNDLDATATAEATDGVVEFSGLAEGYYLVISTGTYDGVSMTTGILVKVYDTDEADSVTGTTVALKSTTPTLVKEVAYGTAYGDYATAGLVDGVTSITYRLTGTVASNIADYATYSYKFTDTLPTGITLTDSSNLSYTVTAVLDGTTYTITESLPASIAEDGGSITWSTGDLIAVLEAQGIEKSAMAGVSIVVDYTVTLDADDIAAVYGTVSSLDDPLVNTAYVTFSNDPYADGTGTVTDTPEDTTKVYSFNLVVDKVDETGAALTGASFSLTDSEGNSAGNDVTVYSDEDGVSTFTFTGLAEGTYVLTETVTPEGYKSIDPITFTITATTDEDGTEVVSITVDGAYDSDTATYTVGDATFSISGATLTATVVNVEGQDLPLTGAQGIALGIVAGAAVIAVSAFALVRRRREDDGEAEEA